MIKLADEQTVQVWLAKKLGLIGGKLIIKLNGIEQDHVVSFTTGESGKIEFHHFEWDGEQPVRPLKLDINGDIETVIKKGKVEAFIV